jgi:hypothetical protein
MYPPLPENPVYEDRLFATLDVPAAEAHKVIIEGVENHVVECVTARFQPRLWRPRSWRRRQLVRHHFEQHNGVVNLGLQMALDRLFANPTTPASISSIGIASDNATVTATTVFLGGAAGAILSGGTQNGFIRTISPATTRTNQVSTAGATFTQADMSGALFVIHKVGLLNAATDVGIFDVIGGTGGAAPFNQPFTIDLTTVTTWSLTLQIQVTAANA